MDGPEVAEGRELPKDDRSSEGNLEAPWDEWFKKIVKIVEHTLGKACCSHPKRSAAVLPFKKVLPSIQGAAVRTKKSAEVLLVKKTAHPGGMSDQIDEWELFFG